MCVCVCLPAFEMLAVVGQSNWPWDHKPWAVDTQTQHDAEGSSPQPHSLAAGMEMVESQRMAVKREMMEDEEDEAAAAADKDECVRETSSEDYCSPIVCPAPVMWTGQSHATEIPVADCSSSAPPFFSGRHCGDPHLLASPTVCIAPHFAHSQKLV